MRQLAVRSTRAAARALLGCVLAAAGGAHADEASELALGKQVFTTLANPACAVCHTLKDAGAEGAIGPSLDELQPSAAQVETAVRGGLGIMPAYEGKLSAEQIRAVARYVAHASRR